MKSLVTKLALFTVGIVAMLTSPAFAHRPNHVAHVNRSAIYNMIPDYFSRTPSRLNSDDPALTGGGSLGYNKNLYNW
jgi:hypothetical protein